MTNISKFAYKAVWDASDLTKGLMNSRAMFAAQKKIVEDSRTPFERLAIGQENLNKLIEKYPELAAQRLRLEQQLEKQYLLQERAIRKLDAAEKARLNSLLTAEERESMVAERRARRAAVMDTRRNKLSKSYEYRDVSSDADRMSSGPNWGGTDSKSTTSDLATAAKAASLAAIAYKSVQLISSQISKGIDANREVEKASNTFDHFGNSVGTSTKMIARLREMSADLGVSFKSMAAGGAQLMLKGFSSDETLKRMGQLAQVSGGDAEKMNRLATAMAQVKDKGRFYAEELMQLQEAGFSPTIELAQILGVKIADVRKEMEAGNVTWVELGKALDKATEAGGRYFGYLEKMKGTSQGVANEAASAWEDAYARIGKAWSPLDKMWNKASAFVAKDIGQLASSISPAETIAASDPRAEARAKREKEYNDRQSANRKREQDALKEIAAREEEQKNVAMSGMADQQLELIKELVPEDELKRFEKTFSLLSDYNKELAKTQALENFKSGLGLGDFTSMLDKEAKLEFKKTEELRKQVEQKQKLLAFEERYADYAKSLVSDDQKKVNALADLEMAKRFGGLSQEDYDRESRKLVASDSMGNGLAGNLRAGSQEAYAFLVGLEDRKTKETIARHKETIELQRLQLAAMKEVEKRLEELDIATQK